MQNLVDSIASFAPTLAGMLGGPLAATAVTAIEGALGVTVGAVPHLAEAGLTPEAIVALKKADLEHQEAMAQLVVTDKASARSREIAVKDNTPKVLTYVYTLAFFATIGLEFYIGTNNIVLQESVKSTLDTMFGVLLGVVIGAKEYYLGTSHTEAGK